jgi:hypothetical protein
VERCVRALQAGNLDFTVIVSDRSPVTLEVLYPPTVPLVSSPSVDYLMHLATHLERNGVAACPVKLHERVNGERLAIEQLAAVDRSPISIRSPVTSAVPSIDEMRQQKPEALSSGIEIGTGAQSTPMRMREAPNHVAVADDLACLGVGNAWQIRQPIATVLAILEHIEPEGHHPFSK